MRNKRLFEKIVRMEQPELKHWLTIQLQAAGYLEQVDEDGFLYAPGTVPVMLLAHLDTVHKQPVKEVCWDKNYNVAMSPQGIGGDDRCGVYMILRIIRDLKCHVLFCEDEETGGIGARQFAGSNILPAVNFLVEFDRRGNNDAVFYDCGNREFVDLLESHGFAEDWGTFSDICTVAPVLKVAAVNISSGYYNEHTLYESVHMDEMNTNADRIAALIRESGGEHYKWVQSSRSWYGNWRSAYNWDYEDDPWGDDYWTQAYSRSATAQTRRWPNDLSDETHSYLMTLDKIGHDLYVYAESQDDFIISHKNAADFAIDEDENLYCKTSDNRWAFLETPYGIIDETTNNYIDFLRGRAVLCEIDWSWHGEEEEEVPT